jgi:hypothetical protein
MSVQLESTEAAILNRVIQPESGDLPRAAAEAILGIGFDPKDREVSFDHLLMRLRQLEARAKKLAAVYPVMFVVDMLADEGGAPL